METEINTLQSKYESGKSNRKKVKDKISELQKLQGRLKTYHKYKSIVETYESKFFGKDKYYREHESEIKKYYGCKKNIPEEWLNETDWEKKIGTEIKNLTKKVQNYSAELNPINEELQKLKKLKWCYEVSVGNINPDAEEKANCKPSILQKMEEMKKQIDGQKKTAPSVKREQNLS